MASNHRSNECVYDEAYADEAYKQNPQRGIGVRIINLDVPFLPLLNRKCRAGTGLGLGSNAATLLSSGTEEWSRMKKKSKGERKSESERFSIVGRNGPRIPFPFSLPKYMLEFVFLGLNNASISQCGSWLCPPSPSFAPP